MGSFLAAICKHPTKPHPERQDPWCNIRIPIKERCTERDPLEPLLGLLLEVCNSPMHLNNSKLDHMLPDRRKRLLSSSNQE